MSQNVEGKDRFPLLRKILGALGLSPDAIDDIVERILDWLAAKNEPQAGPESYPFRLRDDFLSRAELSLCQVLTSVVGDRAKVCPKVGLADLFFAETGEGEFLGLGRKVTAATNLWHQAHCILGLPG